MAAGQNRLASELNEKKVMELLEDLSNILGAFLKKKKNYSIRTCWIWDDYSQLGAVITYPI